MNAWFQIEDLNCTIQQMPVLHSIVLRAERGEFIGLLGVNGAGKSTLLDIASGVRRADSGRIIVAGCDTSSMDTASRAKLICHLPQGVRGELPFTVEQIVMMGRYPHADRWMQSREDSDAVGQALARAQCEDLRMRRFSTLSGGERQRVLLAACLAQTAMLLLMDEPSTYLDIGHQLHCFDLLRGETQRGALCIAVTHDVNLALAHCSRIVVLDAGRVVFDKSVADAWRDREWLARFSERLRIETSAAGSSWVAYR